MIPALTRIPEATRKARMISTQAFGGSEDRRKVVQTGSKRLVEVLMKQASLKECGSEHGQGDDDSLDGLKEEKVRSDRRVFSSSGRPTHGIGSLGPVAGNELEEQSKKLGLSKREAVVTELEERGDEVGSGVGASKGEEERRLDLLLVGGLGVSSRTGECPILGESSSEDVRLVGGVDFERETKEEGQLRNGTQIECSEASRSKISFSSMNLEAPSFMRGVNHEKVTLEKRLAVRAGFSFRSSSFSTVSSSSSSLILPSSTAPKVPFHSGPRHSSANAAAPTATNAT